MVSKVLDAIFKRSLQVSSDDLKFDFSKYMRSTKIGNYFDDIYTTPSQSELLLGKFFIMRTLLIMSVAYYYTSPLTLFALLLFTIVFDSLTGFYQHTLMNFFHKTKYKSKILMTSQNLIKRISIDIFRAEVIVFFVSGFSVFTFAEQGHILINRFTSASYYFNAVLIDKLVATRAISRHFRSQFVIFASTVGGVLCLFHLAKTSFPTWIPKNISEGLTNLLPGPLTMLIYFNVVIFIILFTFYHWSKYHNRSYK